MESRNNNFGKTKKMNSEFMKLAIDEARKALNDIGNGPFGACVVKNGTVISVAHNTVVLDNDPTAHAEINAIRKACKKLETYDLSGCELYSTSEPCPMCMSAIYWSHLDKLYYGCSKDHAAEAGFDDRFIYEELEKPEEERKLEVVPNVLADDCSTLFDLWSSKEDKIEY